MCFMNVLPFLLRFELMIKLRPDSKPQHNLLTFNKISGLEHSLKLNTLR